MPLLEQLKTLTGSLQNCFLEIGSECGSCFNDKIYGMVFYDIELWV